MTLEGYEARAHVMNAILAHANRQLRYAADAADEGTGTEEDEYAWLYLINKLEQLGADARHAMEAIEHAVKREGRK